MLQYYDWIYLSPHLDDVALSCGGQVYQHTQAGQTVLVVSTMAGDPPVEEVSAYAQSLHTRWELAAEAAAARRAEDLAACAILGADAEHWPIPDCIYRHGPDGAPFYVSDPDIFGEIAPAEQGLAVELARRLAALPAHGRVVVSLTVGHHVDHQLVRLAAEAVWSPAALLYYEEYPYAQQPGKLAQVVGEEAAGWTAETIPLTPAALTAKFAAVAAFVSQLSTFFTGRADLEAQIGGYAAATGGERLWRRAA
jgi:LmbE family N-acetylglucosaminyl deacetylase